MDGFSEIKNLLSKSLGCSSKISGIYLVKIGSVKNLSKIFRYETINENLDEILSLKLSSFEDTEYDNEGYYFYKFGLSQDINDRFKTHYRNYKNLGIEYAKLNSCDKIVISSELEYFKSFENRKNINLKYYEDKVKLMLCHYSHCETFVKKDFLGNNYNEIVIIHDSVIERVKKFYDNMDKSEYLEEYFRTYKINPEILELKNYYCKKSTTKNYESKKHLCKFCGEIEEDKFEKGRYTTCKKCRSSSKKLEKEIEEKDKEPLNIDVSNHIKKYILLDYSDFEGFSIKQVIDNLRIENNHKDERILTLENKNSMLEMEYFKLSCELNDIRNVIKELKFKN